MFRFVRAASALNRAMTQRDEHAIQEAMQRFPPNDTLSRAMLAWYRDKHGHPKAAFELRRQILSINPKDVIALRGVAEYWAKRGEVEFACEAIRRVMDIDRAKPEPDLRWVNRLVHALAVLFGRRDVEQRMLRGMCDAKRWDRDWNAWAEEYLAIHATPSTETIH